MFYPGQQRSDLLRLVAESYARHPRLARFAAYCRLKEQGLRQKAFAEARAFVEDVNALHLDAKFAAVDDLLALAATTDVPHLVPHFVRSELIEPTCRLWIEHHPDDPRAYRWLGGHENWTRAIALDPGDEIARAALLDVIMRALNYGLHELPRCFCFPRAEIAAGIEDCERLIGGFPTSRMAGRYWAELAATRLLFERHRGDPGIPE